MAMAMEWSEYQRDIFAAVEGTEDSLIVDAVAGSGKTTTLVEMVHRIPKGRRVIFLAFNKGIQLALEKRVPKALAQCRTLHAVGLAAWKGHLGWGANNCDVSDGKTSVIVSERLSWPQRTAYGGQIAKLVGIAKGAGLVPGGEEFEGMRGLATDSVSVWRELIDFYDLDQFVKPDGSTDTVGIRLAREVLAEGIRRSEKVIDFDDMLYMPVISRVPFEKYDVVLLDEAQDVNSMQVEIVERLLAPGGRVIAVGDPRQAIYGFRGALTGSMDHIAARFKCTRLPLSVSYRCAKKVVAEAQRYVSHILPFEDSPEGSVRQAGNWVIAEFRASDAILCRLNAPIVTLAFHLIRNKKPCRIAGRDIASGITSLVKKMKATGMDDLLTKLAAWRKREILRADGDEGKIARMQDRLATVNVFIDELGPGDTVADLIASIERMFSDLQSSGLLTLSSVHKAKGLEWPRVFILDAEAYMPLPWAREGWEFEQEMNLLYVAITRAKSELWYLSSEGVGIASRRVPGEGSA